MGKFVIEKMYEVDLKGHLYFPKNFYGTTDMDKVKQYIKEHFDEIKWSFE